MISRPRSPLLLVCSIGLWLAPTEAVSQGMQEALLDAADAYLQEGNYEASATEYQRFLFFVPEHAAAYYALFQLGLVEHQLGRQQEAMQALRQASRLAPDNEARQRISYRLALAYLAAGHPERAKIELFELIASVSDTTLMTQSTLVAALAFASQGRWKQAGELFQTASVLQQGNPEFREGIAKAVELTHTLSEQQPRKSPRAAKWASTFVPGSGQLYAGRVLTGLTSMAINLGTGYVLYQHLAAKSYRDGALWTTSVWWRYYQGSRVRAEEAAVQANEQHVAALEDELFAVISDASRFLPAGSIAPVRPAR
jgi:tetratricopeptide (TPR) repeat protein